MSENLSHHPDSSLQAPSVEERWVLKPCSTPGLPFLPVLLAPFLLLSPVLLSGKALFWGTPYLQFVPWREWAWEVLRSGQLPLWNPLVGMGAPLAANYQSALFYPPNWLYFLAAELGGSATLAWVQALLVALHLAWAGAGMAVLARRLGLGVLAQTISGLAFGLSGYLVSRAGFLSINSAVAWLPWILLFCYPARSHRRFLRFAGLVVYLGMQLLAGHAQTTWYTLLLAGMWTAFWSWNLALSPGAEHVPGWMEPILAGARGALAGLLRFGLALGVACSLAAIQLLPTAEYLLQSQRAAEVDYELAMTYSFWPWRLSGLLAPNLFGNPAHGDFWGYGNFWEDAAYIGLLPLLLAAGFLLKRKRSGVTALLPDAGSNHSVFLLSIAALAVLLALGKNTPVFPWLYHHIPTFDMFQAPARFLIWAEFGLALLAGMGAEIWRRPEYKALYWTRLGTAGAFAIALGAGLAWYLMGDISPTFIQATALAGGWGLGAGLLTLAVPQPGAGTTRLDRAWTWAAVLFVTADLIVAGWGLNPGLDLDVYGSQAAPAQEVKDMAGGRRIFLPAEDEKALKFERYLLFNTFYPGEEWASLRPLLVPNSNMLEDLPTVNNFDPLVPERYAHWMRTLGRASDRTQARLLDLMGVGVVESVDPSQPSGVTFSKVENELGMRWRWIPCSLAAPDDETALQQVVEGQFDVNEFVVLEGIETGVEPGCGLRAAQAQASIFLLEEQPGRMSFRVDATSTPGWLLLSDVWYPGWRAFVDGRQVPILRADYLFRAVQLSGPGTKEVIFEYRPLSFRLGAALSLATVVFLAISIYREFHGRATGPLSKR